MTLLLGERERENVLELSTRNKRAEDREHPGGPRSRAWLPPSRGAPSPLEEAEFPQAGLQLNLLRAQFDFSAKILEEGVERCPGTLRRAWFSSCC